LIELVSSISARRIVSIVISTGALLLRTKILQTRRTRAIFRKVFEEQWLRIN
jgi:hypothetical protein